VPNEPRISVVTIAKNNEFGLQLTLENLHSQKEKNWELILVIGESNDSTFQIAEKFALNDNRVRIISQQGNGIYTAMNIAIHASQSDLIWFMNSGDTFATDDSLETGCKIAENTLHKIIIGGHIVRSKKGNDSVFLGKPGDIKSLNFAFNRRHGCHQSTVFKTNFIRELGLYSEDYNYAADFDLVLRALKSGPALGISNVLSIVEPGGVTDSNLTAMLNEKDLIRREVFSNIFVSLASGLWTYLAKLKIIIKEEIEKSSKREGLSSQ